MTTNAALRGDVAVNLPERLLSISRPLTMITIVVLYMAGAAPDSPYMALYAISAACFLASSAIVVGWIPASRSLRRLTLWLELILAALLNWTAGNSSPGMMAVLYSPVMVTFVLEFERNLWVPGVAATVISWLLTTIPSWLPEPALWRQLASYGALLLFSASIGLLIRTLTDEKERSAALLQQVSESQAALQRAHRQLQDTASRQHELAVLEERQRLARDMHDSVAHSLTALLVQIQAGRRLLAAEPDRATETFAGCETLAREALQDTRRAVRALHPAGLEQQNEASALRRLGSDFGMATGMVVEVTVDAAAASLPAEPRRLEQLYRIFQEALTNAHRHGQASHVRADLTAANDQLHLSIQNDGQPPASIDPGVGLRSMQERAQAVGGAVQFEPAPRGLTIRVTVPLGQEERQ